MSELQRKGRAVVICTGRRTGSTLLADGLRSTGRIGKAAEYFDVHQGNRNFWINRLAIQDETEYFEKVIAEGTTPNGVFGLKLHWYQIPAIVYFYNRAYGIDPVDPRQKTFHRILNERFLSTDLLWLRRRNKIAQGISDYRAIRSDVWRVRRGSDVKEVNAKQQVSFDFAGIDRQVKLAEAFDRHWQEYFITYRLKATVLIYEELIENYEPTIRAICRVLGLDAPPLMIGAPSWEQQADDISEAWEREYLEIKRHTEATPAVQVQTPLPAEPPPSLPVEPAPAEPLPLIAYDIGTKFNMKLVPASPRRAWMDATSQHFANRCLPLIIANQNGWMLLSPCRIEVIWNGGGMAEDLSITYPPDEQHVFAASHFGSGILTFMLEFIFRTPPGFNLCVRGPANMPKDGIYPLEGIVETDWSESTFTMNWKITRPDHMIVFEKDEPLVMLTPIARGEIERFAPEIQCLDDNPQLAAGYLEWSNSRSNFNKDLKNEEPDAKKIGWQKHYVRGETVTQIKAAEHQTSVVLAAFVDKREVKKQDG